MIADRDALAVDLERAVAEAAGAPTRVAGLRPLAGGASQEAWSVDVAVEAGAWAGRHALVLKRDLGGALSRMVLTRAQEFAVLRAVHAGGAPAPRPYWFFPDLGGAGRPAFLMERLIGETIGRRIVRDAAFAEARARLPGQMGEALAAIHAIDPTTPDLTFLRRPAAGQSAATATLAELEADLRAIDEPHPALELGLRWLRAHAPPPAPTVLVHGDYRVGNLVVGPDGLRGVLDWEVAYIGDPHADLGWACVRAWRFGQDHLPAGGVGEREAFFAAYERASGRPVDRWLAFYWEALGNFQWALGALGQARRHLSGVAPSVELASLGRICAEMELELLDLIARHDRGQAPTPATPEGARHAG
jgi:aminoglycoside phosphotransferase (APT) family kinase protein